MFDGLDEQIALPSLNTAECLPDFLRFAELPGARSRDEEMEEHIDSAQWDVSVQDGAGVEENDAVIGKHPEQEKQGGGWWLCSQHGLYFESRRKLREHKRQGSCKGKRTGGEEAGTGLLY